MKDAFDRALQAGARWLARSRGAILFNCATALLAGWFTYTILGLFPYYPPDWLWPVVAAVFVAWLIQPGLGVVLALGVFLLPIGYNSATLGLLFILLFLFISILEIGALGPYGFLVLAGTTLVALEPQWAPLLLAAPLLAGFLGARRGVILGSLACFWVEFLGLLSGQANIGLLSLRAQTTALISLNSEPVSSILDIGWLGPVIADRKLDTDLISGLFSPFGEHPLLWAQAGLWAMTACIVGVLISRPLIRKIPARYTALLGGLLVLGAGSLVLAQSVADGSTDLNPLLIALLAPAVLAAIAAPVLEKAVPHPSGARTLRQARTPTNKAADLRNRARSRATGHEVFISYSSKDKDVVDGIAADLEAAGLSCWIAPRDIRPGEDWPTAITNAIIASRVMVLVFTQNANLSEEVSRELYLAANSKVVIIPFKIESVEPEPGKAYYLSRAEGLNALNPPTQEQIARLMSIIRNVKETPG